MSSCLIAMVESPAADWIVNGLPFLKKTGVDLIKAAYKTEAEAEQKIPAGLASFYQQKYPDMHGKRTADIQCTLMFQSSASRTLPK